MKINKQISKIKENWLIALIVLVLIVFFSGNFSQTSFVSKSFDSGYGAPMAESMVSVGRAISPGFLSDFAPEVEERKITKTASLSSEVKRKTFKQSEVKLKSIVKASDSFILNENVNKFGKDKTAYFRGSYQIKVETSKYSSVISQIMEIGEVTTFSENTQDVTGRYTDINIELEVEKERLDRYQKMYANAKEVKDQIELNDRIFNQERTIKYLENSLANIDQRIEYTTIYATITEKQSEYVNFAIIKISDILKAIVNSFNSLVNLVFVVIPWAILLLIIRIVYKKVSKK